MNLWRKKIGKKINSLRFKKSFKKRRKMMKRSRKVEMKDVMLMKDTEILGAREIPNGMVHLGVPKEDKKMKGILESCCRQEDLPKYDISISRRTSGETSSTSCDVCMDVFSIRDLFCASSCKHRICKDCIETYLLKEIQEDATHVVCPESKCKDVLKPEFCSRLIPEEVFDRWKSELTLASSFGKKRIKCPYSDCEEVFMDDAKGYAIRACPKCWNLICMPCGRVEWHIGKDCETFRMESMYPYHYGKLQRYHPHLGKMYSFARFGRFGRFSDYNDG